MSKKSLISDFFYIDLYKLFEQFLVKNKIKTKAETSFAIKIKIFK